MPEAELLENGNILVTVPVLLKLNGGCHRIVQPDQPEEMPSAILTNLARGYCWQKMIDSGRFPNIRALAEKIGIDPGVVAKAIRLTLLSPKMIHEIVTGVSNLTAAELRQSIPPLWSEQEKLYSK